MGCCVSTNTTSPPPPHISNGGAGSKSPPPTYPLFQEETVKEVLSSEITTTATGTIPNQLQHPSPTIPRIFRQTERRKHHQNGVVFNNIKPFVSFGNDHDCTSEVESEICSTHSETTVSVEKSENNAADFQRRSPARFKNRFFSGEELVKREKTVGRSPGRRSNPSPIRNRPGHPGPGHGTRRDSASASGESSGRRSRSPVIRSGLNGSGKTDKSPGRGRSGSGSGERIREEQQAEESTWPPTSGNELLENPLVSLECFIFL